MAKKSEEGKLTELQKEGIQEIGNIGSGQAANFLSDTIGERVNIGVPQVEIIDLDGENKNLKDQSGGSMFNVFVPITGILGGIVVSLERPHYVKLLKKLKDTEIEGGNDGKGTMMEISETIAEFYMNAVDRFLEVEFGFGEGKVHFMEINTLLKVISSKIREESGEDEECCSDALMIKTDFSIEDSIKGDITLIVEISDIDKLTDALDDVLGLS